MTTPRVKAKQEKVRYFSRLFEKARAETIRDTEALLALLKQGASLRDVHRAAHFAYMTTGLLFTESVWLADARKRLTNAKAGKRTRTLDAYKILGWEDPQVLYSARQKAARGEA